MDTTIKMRLEGEEAREVLRLLFQQEAPTPIPDPEPEQEPESEPEPEIEENTTNVRQCKNCGTTETPSWRYVTADFGPLCNACGIRKMRGKSTKKVGGHVTITGDEKTQFKFERETIVGETITQSGLFDGAKIMDHIKGTLYLIRLREPGGEVVHVHHKKQETLGGNELGAGWRLWEDRE
jgi:hypothetical protein